MIIKLNQEFINKKINIDELTLHFLYNTHNNYFYFNVFENNTDNLFEHNKVITGFVFNNKFKFVSSKSASFANIENIEDFRLETI